MVNQMISLDLMQACHCAGSNCSDADGTASIVGQLDITPDKCRADKELLHAQAKKCVTLSASKQLMAYCKNESTYAYI